MRDEGLSTRGRDDNVTIAEFHDIELERRRKRLTVRASSSRSTTITVTAALDGAARASTTTVVTVCEATGGTATAGEDFTALTGVAVTIPVEQTTGTRTFQFTPVDDDIDEGLSETVILGGTVEPAGLTVRTATLTLADDDGKGIELSEGPVTLREEASATYTVALATQPTGEVTVQVTVRGNRDVTVDQSQSSLTFTDTTWSTPQNTAQTVTVTAADDADARRYGDGDAHGAGADSVLTTITDIPATTTGHARCSSLWTWRRVDEDGGSTTITVGGADGRSVAVEPDGFHRHHLEHAQTGDGVGGARRRCGRRQGGVAPCGFRGGLSRGDGAAAGGRSDGRRRAEGGDLGEARCRSSEGGRGTYTVVLDTQPTGTVRVTPTLTADSDGDVRVSPSSLSFTTSNWKTPKTVTVTAGQDLDHTADSATVSHAVAGADYGEKGVTADDVAVTVSDDDIPSTEIRLSLSKDTCARAAARSG